MPPGALLAAQFEARRECVESRRVRYKERASSGGNVQTLAIPLDAATNRAAVDAYKERQQKRQKTQADATTTGDHADEPEVLPIVPFEACLERWGVAVDFIVAGDDDGVPHKPAPDPYLRACTEFAVAPSDCVAVEDSPSGLQSALAAGVPVVAIANPANAGLPLLDEARAVQGDLTDRAPFGM